MRFRTILLSLAAVATTLAASPAPVADPIASPAAADECTDLEVVGGFDPLPYGVNVACPGIRPGARLNQPAGCTFNFVFRGTSYDAEGNPVDEGLFIGTAGHCVFDSAQPDTVWEEGKGKTVTDATGKRVGETIYGLDEGAWDFALVRIDDWREAEVNPAMCHFGGPTAIATDRAARTMLYHFGQGTGFDRTVQGRSGFVDHYSAGNSVMNFTGTAGPGDSGSGVIDAEGNAVGVLVRLVPGGLAGYIEATDLVRHLARAEQWTGIDYELVTAPLN